MAGFIHDKLDIKLLVLYILGRAAGPIDFATLTDLAMCDPGVDYFLFAEAVSELKDSEHLSVEDGLYAITDKGRRNGADCESSLSPAVRRKCDKRLTRLNAELRRSAQVRAAVEPGENGEFLLKLSLDDETGNLLTLQLLTASQTQCEQMAERFRTYPEHIYHGVLDVLLGQGREPSEQ